MTVAIGKAAVRHANILIQAVDQGKHSEQPHVECQPPQSSSREQQSAPLKAQADQVRLLRKTPTGYFYEEACPITVIVERDIWSKTFNSIHPIT